MSDAAKSMAELMARHTSSLQTLQKGQVVKGTVKKASTTEILLDINAKTEAVVMEKDRRLLKQLLHLIKVGDSVEATVLYPEAENGYPVVSLRHFVEGKMWDEVEKLQKSGEKIDVTVVETTKGGFVVESSTGVSGFMPNSHITEKADPQELLGKTIKASVAEIQKENHKVVFSQKSVITSEVFAKAQQTYKSGTKVRGVVSSITSFGLFVSLPLTTEDHATIDGLVHISEVSWDKVDNLNELFEVGQSVDCVVIGTDRDSKRIDLSIKRLTGDPFAKIVENFPVDKKVSGTVTEMTEQGVLFDLGEVEGVAVEGMMKKDKIPPTTTYSVGETVKATVSAVDPKKRKIYLTPVLLEKPLMYR